MHARTDNVLALPAITASVAGSESLPVIGGIITLTDTTIGGVWGSSNLSILALNSSGVAIQKFVVY